MPTVLPEKQPKQTQSDEDYLIRRAWRPLRLALVILAVFLGISIPILFLEVMSGGQVAEGRWVGVLLFSIFFIPASLVISTALFPLTILSLYRSLKVFPLTTGNPQRKRLQMILLTDIILALIFLTTACYSFYLTLLYSNLSNG